MDGEMREAFKEIRETVQSGTARLDGKLDQANMQFNQHLIEDAKQFQKLSDQVAGVQKRQDGISDTIRIAQAAQNLRDKEQAAARLEEAKERRGYKMALLIAIVTVLLTVIAEGLIHWLSKH